MATILTIGVYGFTARSFVAALERAGTAVLVDVRRRRGVRGSEYAWANSQRLQAALSEAGVRYRHRLDLAPTTDMRLEQRQADRRSGQGPRSRTGLAAAFRDRYVREVLEAADLGTPDDWLPPDGPAALLCVEREPEACHRSLLAERLAAEHGFEVIHLRP